MNPVDAVAVALSGGLGNQLFQYAAARATSLRLDCPLVLDLSLLETRIEGQATRPHMLSAFAIKAGIAGAQMRTGWVEYHQPGYCYDPAFADIGRGTRLNGYFQSEVFFASYREQLREELRLAVPVSRSFTDMSARIQAAGYPVSVHLRRGDFSANPNTLAFHGICGKAYYTKAMQIIEGISKAHPTYVVFSDDPTEARALFGDLPSVMFSETPPDRPWEDMLLKAQCRGHILANSSLGWWASWLNRSEKKTIVAPRRWVSPEAMRNLNTADLYLEGTIII